MDFLDRAELTARFSRQEIVGAFARRIHELRAPDGLAASLARLRRHRGLPTAALIVELSQEIAGADSQIDSREARMIEAIQLALDLHPTR
jgi:tellurite resistance protein